MDYIQIAELFGSAFMASWLTRIFTIRSRVKQERAKADADTIENIRKIVDDIYQPTINNLKEQVECLRMEVKEVRDENDRLKEENGKLRDAIRELQGNPVPAERNVSGPVRPRRANGQFARKNET